MEFIPIYANLHSVGFYQVVDKSRGSFREVKSFGAAKTEEEADRLYAKASEWIRRNTLQK